ncbi:hypothetical protein M378DRAFT_182638 [Amanita muscaria Koide BX008]|uniref:Uncharacterized protein n=1 Tax=Amanita muscaria (strain Koide BX008) TaxID=946122 RepID=A0A0C2RVB1_AMAMK|nr:hypothetical protein M378DRAFT_182638 [Amanita muscaria Koide BX008]
MSRSLKSIQEELVQLRQYQAALEVQRKEEEAMAQEDERKRQAAKEEARPEQASSSTWKTVKLRRSLQQLVTTDSSSKTGKRTVSLGEPLRCDHCVGGGRECVWPQSGKTTACKRCKLAKRGCAVDRVPAGRMAKDADIAEQTPKQKKKARKVKATKKKTVGSPASDDILERLVRALSQNTSVLVDIAGALGTQAEIVEDIAVTHRAMQLLLARDPRWKKVSELQYDNRTLQATRNILAALESDEEPGTSGKVESGEEDAWVKDMMEVDEEEEYVARKGRDVVEDGIGVDGEVRKRRMATDSSDDE